MNNAKILSEQVMFESKFFKVKRVTLERGGKQFTKDIIERRNVVLIIPMTENNEVYLVSQYRDALAKESLEIIAGQMDEGEDPLEAAKRELQEETGLQAEHFKHVATWPLSANMVGKYYLFLATGLKEGESSPDDDEELVTVKMPLEEAIEKAMNGEIEVLSSFASLLLVEKLKKEGKI